MNQTNQLNRTMTRILLAFMLILTGYAGGYAQVVDYLSYDRNGGGSTFIYKLTRGGTGENFKGLSHFNLTPGCEITEDKIKAFIYVPTVNETLPPNAIWTDVTDKVSVGRDGGGTECIPATTSNQNIKVNYGNDAQIIYVKFVFNGNYILGGGNKFTPKFGNRCDVFTVQGPVCGPEALCPLVSVVEGLTQSACVGETVNIPQVKFSAASSGATKYFFDYKIGSTGATVTVESTTNEYILDQSTVNAGSFVVYLLAVRDNLDNSCTSGEAPVTLTVNAKPTMTNTTPASRCDAGTVTLGATASAGTLTWYAESSGGTSLGTGTSFTTPSISTTTTYWVDATNNGCISARSSVVATVNTTPSVS